MSNTTSNVTAGKPKIGGAVFKAPVGTTLPTSTSESISAFTEMGYISDAGVINSNSPSTTAIKAWGGDTVLNVQTEKPDTYHMVFIETSREAVLETVYGADNVDGTLSTGITISANSADLDHQSLVIDMVLRDGGAKRIVIPDCQATTIGDITYADGSVVGYDVTFSCYPDEDGNTHYEYLLGGTSSI